MLASTHQEFEKLHIALLVFCPLSFFISLLSHESNILFFYKIFFAKKCPLTGQSDFNSGASSQADFILNSFLSNFLKFPLCPARTIKATLSLVKSRLPLRSPGWLACCLVVTMQKAEYTGKWLFTAPYWSDPKWNPFPDQTRLEKRNEWSRQSFA